MKQPILNYISRNSYLVPIAFGALTLALLVLTLIPSDILGTSQVWSYDKLGHLVLFGSWTFLLGLYLYVTNEFQLHLLSIFITGVTFGICIEVLQFLLPLDRNADLFDIAFDSIGCLIGVLILDKILPVRE